MAQKPAPNGRRAPTRAPKAKVGQLPASNEQRAVNGNRGGRPRLEITEDHIRQIEQLAGYGVTEAAIAHIIGVDPRTFRRRKSDEAVVLSALQKGKAKAEGLIGQALFNKAKGGDLGAICWWENTRAGRHEVQRLEHTGADQGPIQTQEMTEDEQLQRVTRILSMAEETAEGGGVTTISPRLGLLPTLSERERRELNDLVGAIEHRRYQREPVAWMVEVRRPSAGGHP